MLFQLLLPYLRFSWDSLDLCELASKENLYPAFSVHIRAHPWLVSYLLALRTIKLLSLSLTLSSLSDKSSFLFWVASDLSLFQPKQNMFLELTIIDT